MPKKLFESGKHIESKPQAACARDVHSCFSMRWDLPASVEIKDKEDFFRLIIICKFAVQKK